MNDPQNLNLAVDFDENTQFASVSDTLPETNVNNPESEAFYASVLSGSEDPVGTFETMMEEFKNKGASASIDLVRHSLKQSKDIVKSAVIENIIMDQSIPRDEKTEILRQYSMGNEPEQSLQDEYLNYLSNMKLAKDQQELNFDNLEKVDYKIAKIKINQEVENTLNGFKNLNDKVYTPTSSILSDLKNKSIKVGSNLIDLIDNYNFEASDIAYLPYREVINFGRGLVGVPQFFVELASTIGVQGLSKVGDVTGIEWLQKAYPDIPWGEALNRIRGITSKYGYQETVDTIIDKLLLDKEAFEKGAVAGAFQTIDDTAQYIADKLNPEDPELVKVPLLFSLFFVHKGVKAVKGLREPKVKETESYSDLKDREEGRPGTPNKLKASVKLAIEQPEAKIRTSNEKVGFEVPKNSPFAETIELNPEMANTLGQVLMEDITGEAFKALNVSPVQLLMTYLGPTAFDRIKSPETFFDGFETARIDSLDQLIERSKNLALFEPTFADLTQRIEFGESFIKEAGIILEHPNIRMIGSSVDVRSSGTGLYSSVDFRKSSTEYYNNPHEVAAILEHLKGFIDTKETTKGISELKIEVINPNNSRVFYSPETFSNVLKQIPPNTVTDFKYNIRWEKKADFIDTIKNGTEGFGYQGHQNKILPLRALYALPKAWNMFFNYGRLSKEVQLKRDMAGLRSLGVMNDKLQIILDMVNKEGQKFRDDLAVIYSKMIKYDNPLEYNDIVKELNYNPKADHVNKLQEVLKLTDDINYFTWQIQNMYDINKYVKAGYKGHVTLNDKNFMVKTEGDLAIDLNNVQGFFDLEKQDGYKFTPSDYKFENGKHYIIGADGVPILQLVRLGETFVEQATGRKFNYVSIPPDAILPGAPGWIIPYRRNYMPGMIDNTIFVRRYPKKIEMDGRIIDYATRQKDLDVYKGMQDQTLYTKKLQEYENEVIKNMAPHVETIHGFNSKTEAKAWLDSTTKDDRYVYTTEKGSELSRNDMNAYQVLQESALRASRSRGKALQFAIYEDPLTSLIETSKIAGVRYLMQNSAEQLKLGWLKRWANSNEVNIVENIGDTKYSFAERAAKGFDHTLEQEAAAFDKFPLMKEDIQPVAGKEKLHTQAVEEWEAITNMTKGFEDNMLAIGINKLAEYGGEIAEQKGWKRLEKAMLKLERNPNLPVDVLTKIPTTMYVSIANPVKHWIQQPFQGLGYMTIASKGNPLVFYSIAKDVVNTGRVLLMKNLRKQDYEKFVYDHINKVTDIAGEGSSKLSFQDHLLILKYGRESGLFRMNEHIFAKDTFFHKGPGLVREGFLKRNARAFTNFMSTIGLQTGEFIHRLSAFHSSKRIWEERNPGKNWRTSKALDEINYGARQLTQSMDAMASNTFQRSGILRPFAMLQTFVVRSAESAISGEATPFSPKQRAALLGFNIATYGIGAGVPLGLGYFVVKLLSETLGEQAAQEIDEANLTDVTYQLAFDTLFPTYDENGNQVFTTTRPSGYLSQSGGADSPGSFYGTMIKAALQAGFGMEFEGGAGQGNVAATYWKNAFANVNLMARMWGLERPTDEEITGSITQLAKLSSLSKSILNGFLYEAGTKMSVSAKSGQQSGFEVSIGDKLGSILLNTMPESQKQAYKFLAEDDKTEKYMTELAKEYVDALHIMKKSDQMTSVDLVKTFSGFFKAAKDGHGWTGKEFDYFWKAVEARNNQLNRTTKENVLNSLVTNYQKYLNELNKDERNNLQRIIKMGLDNPEVNGDLLTLLKSFESRLEEPIGRTPITTEKRK